MSGLMVSPNIPSSGGALSQESGMGFGAIGAMIGANALSSIFTNNAQAREAQRNRDFQMNMSNTAHQREVADLEKAGLNPILSANAGASTGGGSMATFSAPSIDLPMVYKNRELNQIDAQIGQQQQKINIDKANSAASIAKNLTSAELDRTNALATKGGWLGKVIGTDPMKVIRNAGQGLKDDFRNSRFRNPLNNTQP